MRLARESSINLEIKPVLPMVMRGVPATRQKAVYIFKDAAREARAQGVSYGKFYDPIGEPVIKGYALHAWAKTTGKGNDLLGSFLNAAFVEGINTNNYHGLRHIVEKAGLDWQEARNHLERHRMAFRTGTKPPEHVRIWQLGCAKLSIAGC